MKNKNDVSECIHCHVCQKHCEFLEKYGIDIGDTEKLKELSYHCFLCGKCTEVCPIGIDGRDYILKLMTVVESRLQNLDWKLMKREL